MKVLTLKQPWATLVAEGIKKYEFRSWKTKYRGDFLIHAGLGVDKEALKAALKAVGLSETVRSEQLTMEQLAKLSNELYKSSKQYI